MGGDLPIRGPWGALLDLEWGLFRSADQTGAVTGSPSGASDVTVSIGGYYRWKTKISFKLMVDILAHGQDFSTTGFSFTQRVIAISPSLVYYF